MFNAPADNQVHSLSINVIDSLPLRLNSLTGNLSNC